jgi:hypothetical protein
MYFEGSDGGQTLVRHRVDSEKATSQSDITREVIRHHPVRDKTNDRDQTSFATGSALKPEFDLSAIFALLVALMLQYVHG